MGSRTPAPMRTHAFHWKGALDGLLALLGALLAALVGSRLPE